MITSRLMAKLMEIERAVGPANAPALALTLEAEEIVLQLQQQMIAMLSENESSPMEIYDYSAPAHVAEEGFTAMELSGPLGARRLRPDDPHRIN
jgi:hypothetical protein